MSRALSPAIVALFLLSACGGGGGSSAPAATTTTTTTPDAPAAPVTPAVTASSTPTWAYPAVGTVVSDATCALKYTIAAFNPATGSDPLLANQWHLLNTGQGGGIAGQDADVMPAWLVTKGEGVRVSVADDAVEILHDDLRANVIGGLSHNYASSSVWPLPCAATDIHGTSVAGVVAARDGNGIGGAGVAPRAELIANNSLTTSTDFDIADAMSRDAADTDVYHNSWGSPDDGELHTSPAVWDQAVATGVTSGRDGKGAIYVFAGGNGASVYLKNTTGANGGFNVTTESSNYDGFVNKRQVIAVCAVDDHGAAAPYSESGSNILLCAPSSGGAGTSSVTTTAIGDAYRNDFTGTSASSPIVSGTVALMLSANPRLTWRDVRWILAETAREASPTDASWAASAVTTPAGTAKRYSHRFGYGVVDANAAVALAKSWTSLGGSESLRTCGPFTHTPNVAIPDPATLGGAVSSVTDTIKVGTEADDSGKTPCGISKVEFVEITFNADDHTYTGDLGVELLSPLNRISTLATTRNCGTSLAGADPCTQPFSDWLFGSTRHLGEAATGDWSLRVTDGAFRDHGTFKHWKLTIYGY